MPCEKKGTMSQYRRSTYSDGLVAFSAIWFVGVIIYLGGFYFFHKTGIARPHPTHYHNLLWGFLQGIYVVPSFILSLLNPAHYAIYQTPNIGGWYDFGFLVGGGVLFRGAA